MVGGIRIGIGAVALGLSILVTQSATAFLYPLQSEQVREAYFLGRTSDSEKLKKFLDQCVRHFPPPVKGPHVESVEFRTPYEQVVLRSWERSMGYSAQQAEKDYAAQPDLVVVRVRVRPTPTYPGPFAHASDAKGVAPGRSEDFWPGFRFLVAQEHSIEPKKVSSRYLGRTSLGAREVVLEFDAAQFTSGTVAVDVTAPEDQTIHAEFDLDRLE
jgi:hypothetical protein